MHRPAAPRPSPTRPTSAGWGWWLFLIAFLALLGACRGTVYVEWISGCLVDVETLSFAGLSPRSGLSPAAVVLQVAALTSILAACGTAVWLAQRPRVRVAVVCAGCWVAVGVLASPGYLMQRPAWVSRWSVSLGPGGGVLDVARVAGLALALTTVGVLVARDRRSGRPARRTASPGPTDPTGPVDPLTAAIRSHPDAVIATVGQDGRPEAAQVVVASGADGMIVFDADRASAVITNLQADPRLSLLVGQAGIGCRGTGEVLSGADRDRWLAVYLARFPDRVGRALSDRTAHVLVRPSTTEGE